MEDLEKIRAELNWYGKNGDIASIEKLLKLQDNLAIRSYFLADQLGGIKTEYNHAYFSRKIEFNKAKAGFLNNKKMTLGASEMEAILDVEDIQRKEIELESLGYKLELLLRQVNRVIQATQQRISFLKQEKESTRKQNTT